MARITSIWVRSLALGVALGMAAWGAFYLFFLSHRELGIRPASAVWMGVLGFAVGAVGSLIYFGVNARD